VVDIRANKADSNGPALVGGLVYRVKEDCITVAVEEAPDEGLDQPLRLEKLANEVCTCDRLMTILSARFMSIRAKWRACSISIQQPLRLQRKKVKVFCHATK